MSGPVRRRLGQLGTAIGAVPAAAKEQIGPQRRVIAAQGGDILACIGPDGSVEWSMPIGQCHDLFVLPSGNILTQDGWSRVVEYSEDRSEILCASSRNLSVPSLSKPHVQTLVKWSLTPSALHVIAKGNGTQKQTIPIGLSRYMDFNA